MKLTIEPQSNVGGAFIRGVDLSAPLSNDTVAELRSTWLEHQVIAFPDQHLSLEGLEQYAEKFGALGEDPFFDNLPGHPHIAQVRRDADETSPIFAESWHSDWSFLPEPPQATALYANKIPPMGGDTLFANQYVAWDALPESMKSMLESKQGIHSARRGYAKDGMYGEKDTGRSMAIRYSDDALATQLHPIARVHPETGRTSLFVSMGYTIGIEGMPEDEANSVLLELFAHQAQEEFVYRHHWQENMLIMWDNRCLLHAATGGYDGYARLLHRVTIA